VLGRYLGARHDEPGPEVGYLYGANTLGAVARQPDIPLHFC